MSQYWKTKVAVITGCSSGIGAKIALKLANNGVMVIGLARRTELIDVSKKEIHFYLPIAIYRFTFTYIVPKENDL